jgi:hypothetical protein
MPRRPASRGPGGERHQRQAGRVRPSSTRSVVPSASCAGAADRRTS